jgi:hypothetical protein
MPQDSNDSTKNVTPQNTGSSKKQLLGKKSSVKIKNIFVAAAEKEPATLTAEEIANLKAMLKDQNKKAKLIEQIKFNSRFGSERQKVKKERFNKDFIEPEIAAALKSFKTLAKLKNSQVEDLKKSNQDFSDLQIQVKELVAQLQSELGVKPSAKPK